jgi:hypothetical protein
MSHCRTLYRAEDAQPAFNAPLWHEASAAARLPAWKSPPFDESLYRAITVDEWRHLVAWTRRAADLPPSVRVRCLLKQSMPKGTMGWCRWVAPQSFCIWVDARLPFWLVCEVLLHEWAHCRQFSIFGDQVAEHGPEWGREYAYLHSRWMTEIETVRPMPIIGP